MFNTFFGVDLTFSGLLQISFQVFDHFLIELFVFWMFNFVIFNKFI